MTNPTGAAAIQPIQWNGHTYYNYDEIHRQMLQRIAELEAQLAETWQPVDTEESISCACDMPTCTAWLAIDDDDGLLIVRREEKNVEIYVGDLRLCRKVAKPTPDLLIDWNMHSEEYQWFALDYDGEGYVFKQCPRALSSVFDGGSDVKAIGYFNLNSIDWRATLTTRPNQPPAGVTKVE